MGDFFPEPPTPAERAAGAATRAEFYGAIGDSLGDLYQYIAHEIAQSPPGPMMGAGAGLGVAKWIGKILRKLKLGKKAAGAADDAVKLIDDACEVLAKEVDDALAAADDVVTAADSIDDAAGLIKKWLGDDFVMIRKRSGDLHFLNKEKTRRVAFDINQPNPHDNPHFHVDELINGEWQRSGPVYPRE